MGDTSSQGLQGVRWTGEKEQGQTLGNIPLYPPGPNDTEGWAYLLSIMPKAEPTFCRTLNGATPGVDLRLRAIGNGVVPAVAARAFIVLVQKLEKESGLSI